MVVVRNALNTVLIVDGLVFQPSGNDGDERRVARRTAAITAALDAGQLALVESTPEPGDAFILDEVVGTGVEQDVPHGLGHVPSEVAAAVSYVPEVEYGSGTARAYEIVYGEHTDTDVKVTATSGVRFKLVVSP